MLRSCGGSGGGKDGDDGDDDNDDDDKDEDEDEDKDQVHGGCSDRVGPVRSEVNGEKKFFRDRKSKEDSHRFKIKREARYCE